MSSLKKGSQDEIVLQENVDDEEIAKCLLEGAYHLPGNNYAYVYYYKVKSPVRAPMIRCSFSAF
jgi:hypothetical protein